MKIKHLLIECFCNYDYKNKKTKCPNEIAYTNENGVVEKETDFIGFGNEMEENCIYDKNILIKKWTEICREKINEAYEEYMNNKDK